MLFWETETEVLLSYFNKKSFKLFGKHMERNLLPYIVKSLRIMKLFLSQHMARRQEESMNIFEP